MNVIFLRCVDRLLFWLLIILLIILFFPFKYIFLHKKIAIVSHPKKILVIRLWALWSSLLTFPMIKQLEEHYGKNIQYDLLATSRNMWIFKNQWYFNNIYNLFSLKGVMKMIANIKSYDIVIDSEEYFKISSLVALWVGKITIGYGNLWIRRITYTDPMYYSLYEHNLINCIWLLKSLDIDVYNPEIMEKLIYHPKDTIGVNQFLQSFSNKKILCLHTWWAETSPDRFWSKEKWIKLIKELNVKYRNEVIILLSGTKFEEYLIKELLQRIWKPDNVINICWKFNLFEFAYLLEKCNVMVSNDTGPMHLAAAMGTKTIGLFWPNLPQIFGPWPLDKNVSLYKGTGHIYIKPHLGLFEKDMSHSIDEINPKDVLEAILRLWI